MSTSDKICKTSKPNQWCVECPKIEQEWHIDKILSDLSLAKGVFIFFGDEDVTKEDIADAKVKGVELTNAEQCWLFLLLLGFDLQKIAQYLRKKENTIKSGLTRSIYKYVKRMTGKNIEHWALIRLFLEQENYRKALNSVENEEIEIRLKIPRKYMDKLDLLIDFLNSRTDNPLSIDEIIK